MAGIIDPRELQIQAAFQGLLGLGSGLLEAGGPRVGAPVGLGQGLGVGLGRYQQANRQHTRDGYTNQLLGQQGQLMGNQLNREDQWQQLMQGGPSPAALQGGMSQPGMQPGPTPQAAASVAKADPFASVSPQQRALFGMLGPQAGASHMLNAEAQERQMQRQLAMQRAGKQLDLEYNPQIASAMIPTKVAEAAALTPVEAKRAGAVAEAQLPTQIKVQDRTFGQQQRLQDQAFGQQEKLQAQQLGFTAEEKEKDRGLQMMVKNAEMKAAGAKSTFDRENTLRDEFVMNTKDFRVVQDAHAKITESAKAGTGPGDMSMMYSFIKLLDPNSAVREGEYATAGNAASVPERIRQAYNKALEGELFDPAVRKKFKEEADRIYGAQLQGYDRLKGKYGDLADKYGVDKDNVIVDYAKPKEAKVLKYNPETGLIE